jgi:hypothetical protein
MADRAASVGSFIFFGVFAMSVVASLLRWTTVAADVCQPRHERVSLEIPSGPPRGSWFKMSRQDIPVPLGYPIGLANRWKRFGKDSLIIVKG